MLKTGFNLHQIDTNLFENCTKTVIMYFLDLHFKWNQFVSEIWELRDQRMDDYPLMNSPMPTIQICAGYILFATLIGPWYMKNRLPMNVKPFMMVYNISQVVFNLYVFVQVQILHNNYYLYELFVRLIIIKIEYYSNISKRYIFHKSYVTDIWHIP